MFLYFFGIPKGHFTSFPDYYDFGIDADQIQYTFRMEISEENVQGEKADKIIYIDAKKDGEIEPFNKEMQKLLDDRWPKERQRFVKIKTLSSKKIYKFFEVEAGKERPFPINKSGMP